MDNPATADANVTATGAWKDVFPLSTLSTELRFRVTKAIVQARVPVAATALAEIATMRPTRTSERLGLSRIIGLGDSGKIPNFTPCMTRIPSLPTNTFTDLERSDC